MLTIKNLNVNLQEENKQILFDVNLQVNPGEVHLLNGRNGSGKSTLVNAIMGNPAFNITSGEVKIENENYSEHIISAIDEEFVSKNADGTYTVVCNEIEPNERSFAGLYLANQYPTEIPGVSLMNYLRLIYNIRRPKEEQMSVFKFKTLVEEKAEIIKYPKALLQRNLNEGFSGGEKKKTEILQMLILEQRYVMLDEIDSGLDKHSITEVFEGLANYKTQNPQTSFIIITHYDKAQEYLKPDYTHQMDSGKLVELKF